MKNEKTNRVNEVLALPLGETFQKELAGELELRGQAGVTVIAFIDLDRFLRVNEQFGRAAGDEVLIQTGRYLAENLPPKATLYRYGGDQFAILFGDEEEREDVLLAMEALRKGYCVKAPDGSEITISIGIASSPDDADNMGELVRKAGGAMFRAKTSGHNRVCLAREEKMITKTSHYTADQLQRLTKVAKREGIGEAILLREALDALLRKYDA